MNIAMITETTLPPVNRANLRLYKIAEKLVARGHVVYFVSPSKLPWKTTVFTFKDINIIQFPGFENYLYSKLRLIVRLFHFFTGVLTLFYITKKYKIDIIEGWNPLAGLASVISALLAGRRSFLDFTDFYSDIGSQGDTSKTISVLLEKIERFILKHATKVFVVSSIMVNRITKLGVDPHKIHIVEDGVDKDFFNPGINGSVVRERLGFGRDDIILIYHGDIKEQDGVDVLYRVFKLLLDKHKNIGLLVVGGGGDYFNKEIKMLAMELGIDNKITYTGWVPHNEVPHIIAAADIGVMSVRKTLNHDCYISFKLFEYWASSKPVVCTKLDAISGFLKDGVHGLVAEDGDIEGYVNAFNLLIEDDGLRRQIGANGRKLVEDYFNWDSITDKAMEFYR